MRDWEAVVAASVRAEKYILSRLLEPAAATLGMMLAAESSAVHMCLDLWIQTSWEIHSAGSDLFGTLTAEALQKHRTAEPPKAGSLVAGAPVQSHTVGVADPG